MKERTRTNIRREERREEGRELLHRRGDGYIEYRPAKKSTRWTPLVDRNPGPDGRGQTSERVHWEISEQGTFLSRGRAAVNESMAGSKPYLVANPAA
jgi:hypothetical protein